MLVVSGGPCSPPCRVVPNVDALPVGEAEQKLEADELMSRIDPLPDSHDKGIVISTNPPGNTKATVGSVVVIRVSSGPAVTPTTTPTTIPTNGAGPVVVPVPGGDGGAEPAKLPNVVGLKADDAEKKLKDLGLTVDRMRMRMRSNKAALDTVLLSDPPADSPFKKGDTVKLTLAEPTGPILLLKAAPAAQWSSTDGSQPVHIPLTFPGDPADGNGFALRLPEALLEDGTTAEVLETHPHPQPNGTITGRFTLPGPTIEGDHLRAMVGFLEGGSGDAEFVVIVDRENLAEVVDGAADGGLKLIDVPLPAGTTVVEIVVLTGPDDPGDQEETVWKDLRIEGQIG